MNSVCFKSKTLKIYGIGVFSDCCKGSFAISFKGSCSRFWIFVIVITQFVQITRSLLVKILVTLCTSVQTVKDRNQFQPPLTQESKGCSTAFSLTSYIYMYIKLYCNWCYHDWNKKLFIPNITDTGSDFLLKLTGTKARLWQTRGCFGCSNVCMCLCLYQYV